MKEELIKSLAVNGGEKAVKSLPSRGHFGAEEKNAANRVFDEAIARGQAPGYGGAEEEALCREFSEMLGGGYADAVSSGTAAVYIALKALDIEPFSEIISGPITDPGGLMPIVMLNCVPIIADSEKDSFNISLESIKSLVTERTRAIVVAHIAGEPADIENIVKFAHERGIYVVEDCAQAHGAKINGKPVGTFGDTAAFSMMFGKHTCTGGQGGLVFTKSEELYWKVRQSSDRGKPFGLPAGSTNCVATLNYNLDEVGCAIGRVQIKKMFPIAEARRKVVAKLMEKISGLGILRLAPLPEKSEPSYWFLRLLIDTSKLTCGKQEFVEALAAEGVPAVSRYQATPFTYDWYKNRRVFGKSGYPWSAPEYKGDRNKYYTLDDVPNAAEALDNTFQIYTNESFTDEHIEQVADAFKKVAAAYGK
ncbi:MAG: hypothetical protein GX541_01515 [Clostridiales bacterium]|nr:hypothetical protein [Clostridiales bacterium]